MTVAWAIIIVAVLFLLTFSRGFRRTIGLTSLAAATLVVVALGLVKAYEQLTAEPLSAHFLIHAPWGDEWRVTAPEPVPASEAWRVFADDTQLTLKTPETSLKPWEQYQWRDRATASLDQVKKYGWRVDVDIEGARQ